MIDEEKFQHDLRSILGVLKTLQKLAVRQGDSAEQVLELHTLAIDKLEALLSKMAADSTGQL
jgi:predicted DNA-binding antitoxin AbrB/MazE fold protein